MTQTNIKQTNKQKQNWNIHMQPRSTAQYYNALSVRDQYSNMLHSKFLFITFCYLLFQNK